MKTAFSTSVLLACLAVGSSPAIAGQPSDSEQLWLEMINRFRASPQAELDILTNYVAPGTGTVFANPSSPDAGVANAIAFFGVSAATLRSQFATLSSAPPLAWNSNLHTSAQNHTSAMIAAGIQSHQVPGEATLGQRVGAAGYAFTSLSENIFAFTDNVFHGHAAFLIDWGAGGIQNPPGHRNALIDPFLREIGISLQDPASGPLGPLVVTQDLGRRAGNAFLTGVAYTDRLVEDAFYTIGEGLGSMAVTVFDAARTSIVASTTTFASGGYSLALAGGTYDVQFSGAGYDHFVDDFTFGGAANQKLDFVAAQVPEPEQVVLMLAGLGALLLRRRSRHRRTVPA